MKFKLFSTALILFGSASIAHAEIPIHATRIATGLSKPLFVTSAPGDPNRLYMVEQGGSGSLSGVGRIKIFDYSTGTLNSSPFLSIPGLSTGNEQGLLGLAFSPDYATSGKFYVNLTIGSGTTEVREYTRLDSNTANSNPSKTVLTIAQPQANHNGGWMGFNPSNNYLYIGTGDGGNGDDIGPGHTEPNGNAQDTTSNLLGKILRIDVSGDDFPADSNRNYAIPHSNPFVGTGNDPEIWAYGLRNPWRNSFDRLTHDLYIGDVGQGRTEEIDFESASSAGGLNFGWRKYEGTQERPNSSADTLAGPSPHTPPIHEYDHPNGASRSITGGYVYRGNENPALDGTYFFADYVSKQIWSFKYDGTTKTNFRELTGTIATDAGTIGNITSFGEDDLGRLYIVDAAGQVFRLIPAMPGDANQDNKVDIQDLAALASHWQQPSGALWAGGDFTDDGIVNAKDLGVLADHWQDGTGSAGLSRALVTLGLPIDSVPEPGMGLMVVGLVSGLYGRRRRRSRRNLVPVRGRRDQLSTEAVRSA